LKLFGNISIIKMNNLKVLILSKLTPLAWLYLAALIFLSCALASLWLITHQPTLGLDFKLPSDGVGLQVSAVHTLSAQEKLKVGDTIVAITAEGYQWQALSALSVMEEPDNFTTYHQYNQFIAYNRNLYRILSQAVISLKLLNNKVVVFKPLMYRPISYLPFQYWILVITAGIGFYIGVWIWLYRQQKIEARIIAISGFGFLLGAICLATYSNRELVIDPTQFKLLADINHLGNITFAYSLTTLLCYYPKKIADKPYALFGYVAVFLVWVNVTRQWFEIPIHTFYLLPYIVSSIIAFFLGRKQWIINKNNPVARASIRWFLLTLTVCIGCALILYFIPTFFNETPLLPIWSAQLLILFVYIGCVFGVIQYRLFDIEQWWFNCWVWFFSGCCVIAIDLSLIFFFNSSPLKSMSIAVLITAWCYFPVRQWLWTKNIHPRRSRVDDFFPLLTESYISSSSIKQFEKNWSGILNNIYQPLVIKPYLLPIKSVRLSNNGLSILLPSLNDQQHLVISGKERGGRLFNRDDVRFIESALAYARNCINWKNIREDEANLERERITRDLHDDVGALLLTLIHKAESEDNAQLARKALNGVRETIYSLRDDNQVSFNSTLARWREEIAQRTNAAKVKLVWNITDFPDKFSLTPRQRINLDRILRELITNILKHAHPQTIEMSCCKKNNQLLLVINDDGLSSDSSKWQASTGLYSLNTRAKEIKADLNWESLSANRGTKTTITIP